MSNQFYINNSILPLILFLFNSICLNTNFLLKTIKTQLGPIKFSYDTLKTNYVKLNLFKISLNSFIYKKI